MTDALSGERKVMEKDYGDIDCGCGQDLCPNCKPLNWEDDPCFMCMAGECSDCCASCSVITEGVQK